PCRSSGAETLGQLRLEEAVRLHKFVQLPPVTIADELPPDTNRPVLCSRRHSTRHHRRAALPEHRVCSSPADALIVCLAVGQRQARAVDTHVVVKNARGPASNGTTETMRVRRLAPNEGIRSCCKMPDCKVVSAIVRGATEKQRLLPGSKERVPAISADFGYG